MISYIAFFLYVLGRDCFPLLIFMVIFKPGKFSCLFLYPIDSIYIIYFQEYVWKFLYNLLSLNYNLCL